LAAVVEPDLRACLHAGKRLSIGGRVRRLRDRRRLTQEALAGLVGRTRRWLIAVEQDGVDIRLSDLLRLADALQIPAPDLIGLEPGCQQRPPDPRVSISGGDEVKRREFLRHTTAMLAGVSFLDPDQLARALDRPATIDQHLLDDIRSLLDDYGRQYWHLAPCVLQPPVRNLMATLHGFMGRTGEGRLLRQLQSLAGETAALAGLLAFRLGNRDDARASFGLASELALAAGDQQLHAHALTGLHALYSSVPVGGRGGHTAAALAVLDEAERAAGSEADPLLRTWIRASRAEEHAVLGDSTASHRDLDAAERSLSAAEPRSTGFFSHWDPFRLAGFRGNCELILGLSREAAATLEETLRNTPPSLLGPYACVCADLAAAWALEGEVERACSLLQRGLVVASQAGAGPDGIDRIAGIRHRHLHVDSPAVGDLDEVLQLAR
jgi:transcriptional regulator with XRE-family HTH domain